MFVVTIGFTGYVVHQRFFRPTVKIMDPPLPDEPVTLDAAAAKGAPTAAVVLIEYSDFHCPACLSFSRQTAPGIDAAYVDTGKLLRVYRHYPANPGAHLN